MNSQPQKKSGLEVHLPAPPNELLRDWIRAVDLEPAQKSVSENKLSRSVAGGSQSPQIAVRFYKPKKQRVKVSFAKTKSPP
jgi:hypothetical protein